MNHRHQAVRANSLDNAEVFTAVDFMRPRYTVKQAYEHAAMVHRARFNIPDSVRQLYPSGTYDQTNTNKVLTAVAFSIAVEDILEELAHQEASRGHWTAT